MGLRDFVVSAFALGVAGCASSSADGKAAYVSPLSYQSI